MMWTPTLLLVVAASAQARYQMPKIPQQPQVGAGSEDFCMMKMDGDYALPEQPCSYRYVTCSLGSRLERECASPGLRFSPSSASCVLPDYAEPCGGAPTTSTTLEPVPAEPMPDTGVDCWNAEDGDYPNAFESCSPYYASCVAFNAYTRVCAGDTRFDTVSGRCLEKEYVEACGGRSTTTELPPLEERQKKIIPGFQCGPDGNYQHSSGCSTRFVSCSGGVAEERECYGELKFDVMSGMCLEEAYVEVCGGYGTTTTTAEPIPREPIDFDCSGRTDGNYALGGPAQPQQPKGGYGQKQIQSDFMIGGCSEIFAMCVGGEAFKGSCGAGLKYDAFSNSCMEEEYVEACGGTSTTTLKPIVRPRYRIVFGVDCGELNDGVYADGRTVCSKEFVQCVGGWGYGAVCPGATYYDIQSNSCLEKEWVTDCGGTSTTPVPEGQFEPLPEPNFECSGLEDGDYAMTGSAPQQPKGGYGQRPKASGGMQCSEQYVTCVAGKGVLRECPGALRFDAISSRCLEMEYVQACGGTVTTPQTIVEEPKEPLPDLGNVCGEEEAQLKGDNRPGYECSKYFTACSGGIGVTMECPGSLRFDEPSQECAHALFVAACGGSPSKGQIPQQPQMPQKPKVPQRPKPQIPQQPGVYQRPQQPQLPQKPKTPQRPKTPQQPQVPQRPYSQKPQRPQQPQMPQPPVQKPYQRPTQRPQQPVVPEKPKVPMPRPPQQPQVPRPPVQKPYQRPAKPQQPEIPQPKPTMKPYQRPQRPMPQVPQQPGTPKPTMRPYQRPQRPKPQIPQQPTTPRPTPPTMRPYKRPQRPQTPKVPQQPQIPTSMPPVQRPYWRPRPQKPQQPQRPKVPETPQTPQIPQKPQEPQQPEPQIPQTPSPQPTKRPQRPHQPQLPKNPVQRFRPVYWVTAEEQRPKQKPQIPKPTPQRPREPQLPKQPTVRPTFPPTPGPTQRPKGPIPIFHRGWY